MQSRGWVESAEAMARLEARLDRVLSGDELPRDAPQRIEFADLLYKKALHAEAARMWAEAFAEDAALADDLARNNRYNAACSASLAAARGEADAAESRRHALEWLRADLAAQKAATRLAADLEHWKADPDLAVVRDRLDDLPFAEREGWKKLWADVAALVAREGN